MLILTRSITMRPVIAKLMMMVMVVVVMVMLVALVVLGGEIGNSRIERRDGVGERGRGSRVVGDSDVVTVVAVTRCVTAAASATAGEDAADLQARERQ